MPITPTKKIWMDGELVDWEKATTHVLSHTLHYGTGAFEGIRAYKTPNGVAVFRLREHIQRLFNSCKILMVDVPFTPDELFEATKSGGARERVARRLLHPTAGVLGVRRDGDQPAAVPGERGDRGVAVGSVLGRSRCRERRADEDLVVDAPRPELDADGVQDDRGLRELEPREGRSAQGRLRRSDHARTRRARLGVHRREPLHRA